jgi:hypothetical protein
MATYIQIGSTVTVGAGGASTIDFTSIPATYTDLVIKLSGRYSASTFDGHYIAFNGSTSTFSGKYLYGSGSSTVSGSLARYLGTINGTASTANTFTSTEIYIPNYSGSTNKSFSSDSVTENNATESYANMVAGLWATTSAITSISISLPTGNFVQYSTASLYGIKNS